MLRFCIDLIQSLSDRGPPPHSLHLSVVVAEAPDGAGGSANTARVLGECRSLLSRCRSLLAGVEAAIVALLSMPSRATGRRPVSTELDRSAVRRVRCASTRCRRQTGSLPPRQASLPADQAFTRSLARQDQASSHPTIAVPDVAANLRWTSSTRIVIPPGSDERCYARQTARRQLRYNHNRAVQRERQPLSHRRHPSNAANRPSQSPGGGSGSPGAAPVTRRGGQ